MAMNKVALMSEVDGIISTYNSIIGKMGIENSGQVEMLNENYSFIDCIAFNLTAVSLADGDVGEDEEEFIGEFLAKYDTSKDASDYISLFFRKKSDDYKQMNDKYGHKSSGENSFWWQLTMIMVTSSNTDLIPNVFQPYTDFLNNFLKSDGSADNEEVVYVNSLIQTLSAQLKEFTSQQTGGGSANSSSMDDNLPLVVESFSGTTGNNYGNGKMNITIGVEINNPNQTKMARDINIEITLLDANNNIVDVINDSIYWIDPHSTFHYGIERTWINDNVSQLRVNVFCNNFMEVGSEMGLKALGQFSNFSISHGDDDCTITGYLKNLLEKTFHNCYLHIVLKNNGKIVGGNNVYIDYLPGQQSRTIKIDNCLDLEATDLEYSIDFDFDQLL